jgi:DNA helicase II / ATP-dependent DNA helicase PcrA
VGKVDFSDLLEIAATLISGHQDVADAVRRRWAHVTVDEYQDTDPAQQRLLDAVTGDGRNLCVVGDPRQAIYSWKGADPGYLLVFTERFPTARVFDLTRNYRSSPQIIEWANGLARQPGTNPLRATRSPGKEPKIRRLDTEPGEAAWVAGAARRAIAAGTPASEIAVLYRFNATQARFEAAFARAQIPTVVADDVTFFEREEIRQVLVPFGRAARAQPDRDGLELLNEILDRVGFDRDSPAPGIGAARARWESLVALLELVEDRPDVQRQPAGPMLVEINALAVHGGDHQRAGVALATLHRAKGLEWDLVFVVGATDGAIPSVFATTDDEIAEEERLLHVGVSRARRELHITWAASNPKGWSNRPSPFLDLLPLRISNGEKGHTRQRGRKQAAVNRRAPAGTSPGARPRVAGGRASCGLCASPLKGVAAKRLGVCAGCVITAPGDLGRRARAIVQIATDAAGETGADPTNFVSPEGLLRLLDKRPDSATSVAATPGVRLAGSWANRMAEALKA